VSVFAVDRGTLKEIQQIPTLPPDFTSRNTTAEIQMDKAGHFLYVSNRGANSIAVYAVDPGKGTLTLRRARSRPWSIATQHHDRSNRPILLRRQPAFK
jgi:6-phosphogluconolactonase (cycloisomerase 2 family)